VHPWFPMSFLISSHLCLYSIHFMGAGAGMLVSQMETNQVREVENAMMLASAGEDAEGLTRKVALLEGELVEVRQAQEVAEEKFHSLSNALVDGA
jgi:hypothetical protein